MEKTNAVLWLFPLDSLSYRDATCRPAWDLVDLPGRPGFCPADLLVRKLRHFGFNEFTILFDLVLADGIRPARIEEARDRARAFAERNDFSFSFTERPAELNNPDHVREYVDQFRRGLPNCPGELILLATAGALFQTAQNLERLRGALKPDTLQAALISPQGFERDSLTLVRNEYYTLLGEGRPIPAEGSITVEDDSPSPLPPGGLPLRPRAEFLEILDALPAEKDSWSHDDLAVLWAAQPEVFIPFPNHLGVELTNMDELPRLRSPRQISKRPEGLMSDAHIEMLINALPPNSDLVPCSVDLFDFGEPLLHPRALEVIERLAAKGVRVDLYTNGLALDEGTARRLVSSGVDAVFYRLDAMNSDTYGKVAGDPARWETARDNLDRLVRIKRELQGGMTHPKPTLAVQITEMPETAGDLDAFFERYDQQAVAEKALREKLGHPPTPAEIIRYIVTELEPIEYAMLRHDCLYRGRICRKDNVDFTPLIRFPCRQFTAGPYILCDGRVVPCRVDVEGEQVLGRLEEGLMNVWRNAATRSLLRTHLQGQAAEHPFCGACREWYYPFV